ncbi:Docking protein 1 [Araneus ventricosus]|uniref:Docking protein 1 n=1 Tax=Araneus ventricosus TaxID=182803 RepID=A0A4Y2E2Q5_ARAVE|nr:Docking protein 1 [Araneus ventricosus]
MEMEEALKMGFLFIPPQNFLRKTWMKRYCALYEASNHGIQRMELFETEDAYVKRNPSKIIPLTDCWKVSPLPQKNQPNVFEVTTKTNSYQFSADTFQEMSEWLVSLQKVAFSKSQVKPLVPSVPTNEEKQEENLLYCSMDEPEIYPVKVVATEASLRNNLKGNYKLVITAVSFSIAEECLQGRIGKMILTWPYRHIRRYGCSIENFSFEAGRKCTSGEGLFTLSTTEGIKIFQSIDSHVSALKSTHGDLDIPNSPSIKDDKNNYIYFTSKDSLNSTDSSFSFAISKSEHSVTLPSVGHTESLSHKNVKSLPPFRKPPRKSKSNIHNSGSDKASKIQDSYNQYAEIRRNSTDISIKNTESTHSSNAAEDVSSKMPHSSSDDVFTAADSSNKYDLSSCIENIRISEVPRKDSKVKRAHSSYDYENCDFSFENSTPSLRSGVATEHTYGKLTITRQSAPSNTGNLYGSIITNTSSGASTSPVYCNIPYLKKDNNEPDPEHFLKNDAEYAKVLKKNKNSP